MDMNISAAEEKSKIEGTRYSAFLPLMVLCGHNILFQWLIPAFERPNELETKRILSLRNAQQIEWGREVMNKL
jgi:hypothetical protein